MVLDCKSSEKLHRGFESHSLQESYTYNLIKCYKPQGARLIAMR